MACDRMLSLQDLYDWKDVGVASKPDLTQAPPRYGDFSESAVSADMDRSDIGLYPRGPRAASKGAKTNCQRRYENQ